MNIRVRINLASESWGIVCLRYEVRDINLPLAVHEALQMQVEAERKKRAAILGIILYFKIFNVKKSSNLTPGKCNF